MTDEQKKLLKQIYSRYDAVHDEMLTVPNDMFEDADDSVNTLMLDLMDGDNKELVEKLEEVASLSDEIEGNLERILELLEPEEE